MKYLILSLFLIGCNKENEDIINYSVTKECINTNVLMHICKYTTKNGHSTCMGNDGSTITAHITCDFYDNILK